MTDTLPKPPKPARRPDTIPPWYAPQMRDVLALLSTIIFAAAFALPVLIKGTPSPTLDAELKGAIIIQWGSVMSWYFGSSKGSAQKDDTITTMAAKATKAPDAAEPDKQA